MRLLQQSAGRQGPARAWDAVCACRTAVPPPAGGRGTLPQPGLWRRAWPPARPATCIDAAAPRPPFPGWEAVLRVPAQQAKRTRMHNPRPRAPCCILLVHPQPSQASHNARRHATGRGRRAAGPGVRLPRRPRLPPLPQPRGVHSRRLPIERAGRRGCGGAVTAGRAALGGGPSDARAPHASPQSPAPQPLPVQASSAIPPAAAVSGCSEPGSARVGAPPRGVTPNRPNHRAAAPIPLQTQPAPAPTTLWPDRRSGAGCSTSPLPAVSGAARNAPCLCEPAALPRHLIRSLTAPSPPPPPPFTQACAACTAATMAATTAAAAAGRPAPAPAVAAGRAAAPATAPATGMMTRTVTRARVAGTARAATTATARRAAGTARRAASAAMMMTASGTAGERRRQALTQGSPASALFQAPSLGAPLPPADYLCL